MATLLVDNLSFHKDLDPLVLAKKNFVYVLFLPPNTSHFLQPLDDLVFARYKTHLARLARQLLLALMETKTKRTPAEIITAVTEAAESIAFKPQAIRDSFKNCGMWPIDYQMIENMAYLNIGKPTKHCPSPSNPTGGPQGKSSETELLPRLWNLIREENPREKSPKKPI